MLRNVTCLRIWNILFMILFAERRLHSRDLNMYRFIVILFDFIFSVCCFTFYLFSILISLFVWHYFHVYAYFILARKRFESNPFFNWFYLYRFQGCFFFLIFKCLSSYNDVVFYPFFFFGFSFSLTYSRSLHSFMQLIILRL